MNDFQFDWLSRAIVTISGQLHDIQVMMHSQINDTQQLKQLTKKLAGPTTELDLALKKQTTKKKGNKA